MGELYLLLRRTLPARCEAPGDRSMGFELPQHALSFQLYLGRACGVPVMELCDLRVRRSAGRQGVAIDVIKACREVARSLGRHLLLTHLRDDPPTQDQQNVLAYVRKQTARWVLVGDSVYASYDDPQ